MIIGVIGPIASGKDKVTDFFVKKYGFKRILTSNFLREEAERQDIKVEGRYVLLRIQAELRRKNGDDYIIKLALQKIRDNKWENVVVEGLRTPIDVLEAKRRLKARIILVEAKPEVRFQRQKKRHRKGFQRTYEQFLHEEAIENGALQFYKSVKMAQIKLDNNGSLKDLEKKAEIIAKKLGLKKKK